MPGKLTSGDSIPEECTQVDNVPLVLPTTNPLQFDTSKAYKGKPTLSFLYDQDPQSYIEDSTEANVCEKFGNPGELLRLHLQYDELVPPPPPPPPGEDEWMCDGTAFLMMIRRGRYLLGSLPCTTEGLWTQITGSVVSPGMSWSIPSNNTLPDAEITLTTTGTGVFDPNRAGIVTMTIGGITKTIELQAGRGFTPYPANIETAGKTPPPDLRCYLLTMESTCIATAKPSPSCNDTPSGLYNDQFQVCFRIDIDPVEFPW